MVNTPPFQDSSSLFTAARQWEQHFAGNAGAYGGRVVYQHQSSSALEMLFLDFQLSQSLQFTWMPPAKGNVQLRLDWLYPAAGRPSSLVIREMFASSGNDALRGKTNNDTSLHCSSQIIVRGKIEVVSNLQKDSKGKTLVIEFPEALVRSFMPAVWDEVTDCWFMFPMNQQDRESLLEIDNLNVEEALYETKMETRMRLVLESFLLKLTSEADPNKINLVDPMAPKKPFIPICKHYNAQGERMAWPIQWNLSDIERLSRAESALMTLPFGNPPTIDQLAEIGSMSATSLKKKFRELYRTPVYQYYQQGRMNHARKLLLTKNYTIKEVGNLVGYTNLSHFAIAFKKAFGKLPSAFVHTSTHS